jgi:hypothetical protein
VFEIISLLQTPKILASWAHAQKKNYPIVETHGCLGSSGVRLVDKNFVPTTPRSLDLNPIE